MAIAHQRATEMPQLRLLCSSLKSKRSYLVFKALITGRFLYRQQAFIYTTPESPFDLRMQPTLQPVWMREVKDSKESLSFSCVMWASS